MNVKKLTRLIDHHVEAQIDLSWKGGKDPETLAAIELEAAKATKKLYKYIKRLERENITLRVNQVDV